MEQDNSSTCLQKSANESCLSHFLAHIFTAYFFETQSMLLSRLCLGFWCGLPEAFRSQFCIHERKVSDENRQSTVSLLSSSLIHSFPPIIRAALVKQFTYRQMSSPKTWPVMYTIVKKVLCIEIYSSDACHVSCPPHSLSFSRPNLLPESEYSHRHFIFEHPHCMWSRDRRYLKQ
jgi:hypothetical protein